MNETEVQQWIETRGEFTFSRSSGPGGQNVNKVNTKTTLRIDIALLEGILESERERLLIKLAHRLCGSSIDSQGNAHPGTELVIQVQDERAQILNRKLAVVRTLQIIQAALRREKKRCPTKPTRASKERRLASKKIIALHKTNRKTPYKD